MVREKKTEKPPKLYDLTTLQREANRVFGYPAKQTLDYAQSLYEKKLLTYPRTDSRYLTCDMAETASVVLHLAAQVPPFDACPESFPDVLALVNDKEVSDHHAILPTLELEKADVPGLPVGERNILLLVCCKLLCAAAELVQKYSHISEDGQKLFQPEKETVGICPRCGKPVYEGKKNFACSDRACQFVLWKNDRYQSGQVQRGHPCGRMGEVPHYGGGTETGL